MYPLMSGNKEVLKQEHVKNGLAEKAPIDQAWD